MWIESIRSQDKFEVRGKISLVPNLGRQQDFSLSLSLSSLCLSVSLSLCLSLSIYIYIYLSLSLSLAHQHATVAPVARCFAARLWVAPIHNAPLPPPPAPAARSSASGAGAREVPHTQSGVTACRHRRQPPSAQHVKLFAPVRKKN